MVAERAAKREGARPHRLSWNSSEKLQDDSVETGQSDIAAGQDQSVRSMLSVVISQARAAIGTGVGGMRAFIYRLHGSGAANLGQMDSDRRQGSHWPRLHSRCRRPLQLLRLVERRACSPVALRQRPLTGEGDKAADKPPRSYRYGLHCPLASNLTSVDPVPAGPGGCSLHAV